MLKFATSKVFKFFSKNFQPIRLNNDKSIFMEFQKFRSFWSCPLFFDERSGKAERSLLSLKKSQVVF